jgi:hypothetical protein
MIMQRSAVIVLLGLLMGCSHPSAMRLNDNTAQISTSAAPVCGSQGSQKTALKNAAIETLRGGYDRFVILDGAAENSVRVVGQTPITANTYGTGNVTLNRTYGGYNGTYSGSSSTYVTGGYPIIAGRHDQTYVVRMFRNGEIDPGQSIDARTVLGSDWQKIAAKGLLKTCL